MQSIFRDIRTQFYQGDMAIRFIMCYIAIFLISILFFYQFSLGIFHFPNYVALYSDRQNFMVRFWTIFSYQFFHSGFLHLLSNMLMLYFSSRLFFTFFSNKQFLAVSILGGIFGGIFFLLGYFILDLQGVLIGSSASVMAILMSVTVYSPLMIVRIPLIGYVKLWYITLALILVSDVLQFSISNTGGHLAHLGGCFLGFFYIKLMQRGVDVSKIFNTTKKTKKQFKKVYKNNSVIPKQKIQKDLKQQKIDEILDKISASGYDSLSDAEKEFLFKAGE